MDRQAEAYAYAYEPTVQYAQVHSHKFTAILNGKFVLNKNGIGCGVKINWRNFV